MIETITGLLFYVVPLYFLLFVPYFVVGSLSRTMHVPRLLFGPLVVLGLIALLLTGEGLQFGVALLGYIVGLVVSLSEAKTKTVLKYCLILSLVVAMFDLAYYSRIYDLRFLQCPEFLLDPRLVYFLLASTVFTSLIVAGVWSILFGFFAGISRVTRTSIVVPVMVMYLLESQVHLNTFHPYWIHHPTISAVTAVMFVFGWILSPSCVFDWIKSRRYAVWKISVLYFVLYHAIIEIHESGPGSMFGADYLTICLLVSGITLVFGAFCRDSGRLSQKL